MELPRSFPVLFSNLMNILRKLVLILTLLTTFSSGVYTQTQPMNRLINPFTIHIDPMERLLLVNFEKDPDAIYIGFEPQVFDDDTNGKGHLIIGWRVDGRVDVFHQPTLKLDPTKYDIAGKGLANMVSVDMSTALFEVDQFGVQAAYQFKDIANRTVIIRIHEHHSKQRKPFGLLAPMGDAAMNPSSLPLVLLHDFYFVRRKKTDFHVSINEKIHKPDLLPIPMDWTRMYFARYSPKPLIVTFNPAFEGSLEPIQIPDEEKHVTIGDYNYEVKWVENVPMLKSLTLQNKVHPIRLDFSPAFPNLDQIQPGVSMEGEFVISGHPSTGTVAGNYLICVGEKKVIFTLVPSKGWKPRPTKLSLRFLYGVAKIFKSWPTTYHWEAKLTKTQDEGWFMKSSWKRTGRISFQQT